jgi:hypothetical protein
MVNKALKPKNKEHKLYSHMLGTMLERTLSEQGLGFAYNLLSFFVSISVLAFFLSGLALWIWLNGYVVLLISPH